MALKVNEASAAVAAMKNGWHLVRTLLGGSAAMRAAATEYLPRYEVEESADYATRLSQSTLYPAFGETCQKMKSRAFNEQLKIEDVPQWFESDGIMTNVDMQGRSFPQWGADVFDDGLKEGLVHALIDSPPISEATTEAEQQRRGIRPYAIQIRAERVLGWKQDGKGKLTQVRIMFAREVDETFGTTQIPQVRVYSLVQGVNEAADFVNMQAYEKKEGAEGAEEEWIVHGPLVRMDINYIPLLTYYTKRTGFMTAEPPLMELAQLNVKHWQLQSAIDALQLIACVPILFLTGGDDKTKLTIGSRSAVVGPQGSTLQYVEHTGKAIESGTKNIEELKNQMRDAGGKLLTPGSGQTSAQTQGAKTATQSAEESASDNSALGMMVSDFEAFVTAVCKTLGDWRGEEVKAKPKLTPDLEAGVTVTDRATALGAAVDRGALSNDTYIESLKDLKLLNDTITWEEEQRKIEAQPDLNPVQPEPVNPKKKPAPVAV